VGWVYLLDAHPFYLSRCSFAADFAHTSQGSPASLPATKYFVPVPLPPKPT